MPKPNRPASIEQQKKALTEMLACLNQICERHNGTPAGQLALVGLTNVDRVLRGLEPLYDASSVTSIVMGAGVGKSGRPKVTVSKKADDPLCTRVSCGGSLTIGGFYCVYRGSLKEAIAVLETVVTELKCLAQEPPITPDAGLVPLE